MRMHTKCRSSRVPSSVVVDDDSGYSRVSVVVVETLGEREDEEYDYDYYCKTVRTRVIRQVRQDQTPIQSFRETRKSSLSLNLKGEMNLTRVVICRKEEVNCPKTWDRPW